MFAISNQMRYNKVVGSRSERDKTMKLEKDGKTYYAKPRQLGSLQAWFVVQKYQGSRRVGSIEPVRRGRQMGMWHAFSKTDPSGGLGTERLIGTFETDSEAFRKIVRFYHEKEKQAT